MRHKQGSRLSRMHRVLGIGALSLALLVTAACGGSTEDKNGLKTIRVVQFPGILQGFYPYIADELGDFEKAGYNIDYLNVDGGPALTSALIGGSVDIAFVGTQLIWPVLEKKEDVVMLAGTDKYAYQIVTCGKTKTPNIDKPFPANIQDLKGAKIGVIGPGTQVEQFVQKLGKEAGLEPGDDFKTVTVGGASTMIPACETGQVDFITPPPPAEFLLKHDFGTVASAFDPESTGNLFDGYLSDLWATTGKYLKSNRKTVTDFCQVLSGTRKYATDPANVEEIGALLSKYIGIPKATAVSVWKTYAEAQLLPLSEAAWKSQGKQTGTELPYDEFVDPTCTKILS